MSVRHVVARIGALSAHLAAPRVTFAGGALSVMVVTLSAVFVISAADRLTREDLRFGFFYLAPIGVAAWWGDRRLAVVVASLSAIFLIFNDLSLGGATSWPTLVFNEFTRVSTFLALAILVSAVRLSTRRLREESDQSFRLAVTDSLTGLYNRRFLVEQLDLANSLAERHGREYSILAFDVDGLKKLNDRFGHAAGDVALVALAASVRAVVRFEDIAVRVGGDEFLVLLPNTGESEGIVVGERLLETVLAETRSDRVQSVSAGIATWRKGATAEELTREADALSYESKRRGGARLTRARDLSAARRAQPRRPTDPLPRSN
jgi:diguanylate cyclase (GGDEF)-like protein